MIIDAHNHVAPKPVPSMVTREVKISAEELIEQMKANRIDKAVIFGAGPYIDKEMNNVIVEAQRKYPDRLIGFARVNPYEDRAAAEVESLVTNHGMKGLKLHPGFQSFKMDGIHTQQLIERIAKLEIPVLFHTGEPPHLCHPSMVAPLGERFPDVTLILGHSGEEYFGMDAIRMAKKYDNVYLETSWSAKATIELAVKELGATRIILGTDTPYSHFAIELKKLEVCKMSDDDREKIQGENLRNILHL